MWGSSRIENTPINSFDIWTGAGFITDLSTYGQNVISVGVRTFEAIVGEIEL